MLSTDEKIMWYIQTVEYCIFQQQKWSSDVYYSMDEPWKHFADEKKPGTKGHIFYYSINTKSAE